MKYQALTIGLSDELFSIMQSLLALHLNLIPSLTTKDANHLLEQHTFHLLIVDIEYLRSVHLSDWLSGIRRISFAPIIVLSDTPELDTHLIVQLGADICISSKYHAMIADLAYAQLRRYTEYNYYSNPSRSEVAAFQLGDIFIDPARCKVSVQGQSVNLRPREFSLLLYFMRNPNIVLSSEQICKNAWGMTSGYDYGVSHPIYLLRQQIEPHPKNPLYIQTVRGFGYRFRPYVEICDKCDNNVRKLS
ncbi:response regulator transcription factor [uncultured Oscillibacter sp.]|uniref:winged helix-turn-helix transcriptional regulator n=1 Tax=uncultured Oscillibacter sp. TaxID=876091 RepID=UPI00261902D1|nr:response regulator transcription factor [uncultured Oscillibacter sp.]